MHRASAAMSERFRRSISVARAGLTSGEDKRMPKAQLLSEATDDLAVGRSTLGGLDHSVEDVFVGAVGCASQVIENAIDLILAAAGLERLEALDMRFHASDVGAFRRLCGPAIVRDLVTVDADDLLFAAFDLLLSDERGVSDHGLHEPDFGRLEHSAGSIDPRDHRQYLCLHLLGERLDIIRSRERIDHVAQMRLLAQDVL